MSKVAERPRPDRWTLNISYMDLRTTATMALEICETGETGAFVWDWLDTYR